MFYFQAEVEFICSYYSRILIHREICVWFAANKLQFNVFVCIQLHCSYNTGITEEELISCLEISRYSLRGHTSLC